MLTVPAEKQHEKIRKSWMGGMEGKKMERVAEKRKEEKWRK